MADNHASTPEPSNRALKATAAIAGIHGLWTIFEWRELLVARAGGIPTCAMGDPGACAAVWDSPFARAVEEWTAVPVAGWGTVWSLVALALPLLALRRASRGQRVEPLWSATLWTASAGLGAVGLFAAVSFQVGALCTNCLITYALVLVYVGVALSAARVAPPAALSTGAPLAGMAVAVGFALVLIPGLQTPRASAVNRALLEPTPSAAEHADRGGQPGARDPAAGFAERIRSLPDEHLQFIANVRADYVEPDQPPLRPARGLIGQAMAPVRVTHFSDVLCSHCADLHQTLEQLVESSPPNSVSLEYRKFPLDSACNTSLNVPSQRPDRCTYALGMICMEGNPHAFELEGRLFDQQDRLDEDLFFELAAPFMPPDALARCIASAETRAKLDEDIAWAVEHDIHGTPMVLVNGRMAAPYLPFLYAMVMTAADPDHAVFQGLPEPAEEDHSEHRH